MSQMHDNHPGLKKFREAKANKQKIAVAKKMFPNAASPTIALNLYRCAVNDDGLVKESK